MRTLVTLLALIVIGGVAPIATAQSTNTLIAEGLSLPKDHQYEQYNVVRHLRQGRRGPGAGLPSSKAADL
jgi:hypothetical protein